MQRAAEVEREVVGHVDQRVDRAEAERGQPVLQPLRAGAVAQAADGPPEHPGARLGPRDLPLQPALERGRDRCGAPRLQRAHAGGGEVAGDAANGERVAPVGRYADLDDRVVEPGPCDVGGADRRVVRQLDDAGVVLAQAHLAIGEQHSGTLHATDFSDLERNAGAGDEAAGGGEYTLHAGTRVGGAAHHRGDAVARIDLADAQPVGVRVRGGLDDAGDAECRQCGTAILHAFELQPDHGQRVGDAVERRVGVEVVAQPGEGEFHRLTPPRAASPARAGSRRSGAASGCRSRRTAAGRRCRA